MKNREDYVTQTEAEQLTGLKRTSLYYYRIEGFIAWTKGQSRKILYYKPDLYKLIGLI
jgi:hypothetical protein